MRGTGPYPAIAESRGELPDHTVYRPAELPPAALRLCRSSCPCRPHHFA